MSKPDKPKKSEKQLTLHGITPEEALKKALSTPIPREKSKKPTKKNR